MKKKGFTLVELIAVIVVLSVIILLSIGAYTTVRKNILESQFKNIVIRIENAAEDYAKELQTTDVIYITVDSLIKEGKLSPDDENFIYDPRDNSKMNCYLVKVVFESDEYIAEIQEKHELEDGTCDDTYTTDGSIEIYCDGKKCENDWYNENVVLSIHGIDDEELKTGTVEWTNLLGLYEIQTNGKEKIIKTETDSVLSTVYNATVKIDNKTYNLSKSIKVDKEGPTLISKKIDVDYKSVQAININASDISGSGISGYALTKDTCDNATYSKTNNINVSSNGTFNICLKDNVGNITTTSIKINQITFNVNNVSSNNVVKVPVFYLDEDPNFALLIPTRPGYTFNCWLSQYGNRVYTVEDVKNGDILDADWTIIDTPIVAEKADKDTAGAIIENKVNIIFALDTSGSISSSEMREVKAAATQFVNQMSFDIGSQMSLVTFSTTSKIVVENCTNKQSAINYINSIPNPTGTTNFPAALENVLSITSKLANRDNTYLIFMSDGYSNVGSISSAFSTSEQLKASGVKIYSIAVGSADATTLKNISSGLEYYFSINDFSEIYDILIKIQEEIREETSYLSNGGLIELPNLYVSEEFPFVLKIGGKEYFYTSIGKMENLLTLKNNNYYLDLVKVDNMYKLNGNLAQVKFTYYYG